MAAAKTALGLVGAAAIGAAVAFAATPTAKPAPAPAVAAPPVKKPEPPPHPCTLADPKPSVTYFVATTKIGEAHVIWQGPKGTEEAVVNCRASSLEGVWAACKPVWRKAFCK